MERKPAQSFAADVDAWRAEAERSLRGRPLDSLRKVTDSGLNLEVAYFEHNEPHWWQPPGTGSFRRGAIAESEVGGWDLRARIDRGDIEAVNRRALEELEGGADSLQLVTSSLSIGSAEDLNQALEGIYLDLAPVALEPAADFESWVNWLCEVLTRREHDPALVVGAWNIDPVAMVLAGPRGDQALDELNPEFDGGLLRRAVATAAGAAEAWPQVTALRASSSPVHLAGCSEAQELAAVMSVSVFYLRALEQAGLELDRAFRQIALELQMNADVFGGIAKLRSMRLLWARLAAACDVQLSRGPVIQATTARRMLSRREPMTNALRASSAAIAAALGGADVITVLPYDEALAADVRSQHEAQRALRLARNTQIILREESHLDQVIDSAAGSWYIEARTDRLAEAAWQEFQAIEAAGGIVKDLESGRLQREIAEVAERRRQRMRRRKKVVVGVNDFARIEQAAESASPTVSHTAESLLAAAPLDDEFERFRSASDRYREAVDRRPTVWLAGLGTLAQHGARTTFCRNLLAVGGIEAMQSSGALDPDSLAKSLTRDATGDSPLVILCSSDALYQEHAVGAVSGLRAAGAAAVFYAGNPGDQRAELESAGCDGFIHQGQDVVALFEDLYQRLGVAVDRGGEST